MNEHKSESNFKSIEVYSAQEKVNTLQNTIKFSAT